MYDTGDITQRVQLVRYVQNTKHTSSERLDTFNVFEQNSSG